jgi:2-succinyl-5-enolpyruvyl-6-hydroxy-3-cyclohexene-1-carboxylate synthase
MFTTRYSTLNQLWAALIIEELSRQGVAHFCVGPGSRSAPLALATAAHPRLETHVHHDERGLGFMALGIAKVTARPVAVLTTSGTAVANLYPAVIEASNSGASLVVLSADRPPELLDCGANQAIDQHGIFNRYPRYFANLPCPSESISPAVPLTTVDQALTRCRALAPGPVHLNLPFRDPLYPAEDLRDFSRYLIPLNRWLCCDRPFTEYYVTEGLSVTVPPGETLEAFLDGPGLVVAARLERLEDARAALALARRLGWPLLADIQSQLRFSEGPIGYYDLLFENDGFRANLDNVDRVLQLGGRLTSQRLSRWLARHPWKAYWLVEESWHREDPGHALSGRISQPIAAFCRQGVAVLDRRRRTRRWTRRCDNSKLLGFDRGLELELERWLTADEALSEVFVARTITRRQPRRAVLFAGNSLPIRLLDMFACAEGGDFDVSVFSNRGASGIDGVLATAVGCALGQARPLTLLIGDLSLLHDLSSLMLLRRVRQPFVVVVLNNDGGGIFQMLPVPDRADVRERFFQVSHGLDFAGACEMFGLTYVSPESRRDFIDSYTLALRQPRATVVEVKVPPHRATEMIKRFRRHVGQLDLSA